MQTSRHLSEVWQLASHVVICVDGGERVVIADGRDGFRIIVVSFSLHSDGEASACFEDGQGRSLHGQPFKIAGPGQQFRASWNPHGIFALPEGQDLVLESRGHGSTISGFMTFLLVAK